MDLYTMNENFIPDKIVDEFQSAIWTERYSAAGEVQLVVPADAYYLEMLKEGTFLGLAGTHEIMEIKTDSIENGMLTVVGKTLLKFLDERIHWPRTSDNTQPIGDYTTATDMQLGTVLANRVTEMVISPIPFPGSSSPWNMMNLDWERDKIAHLELGTVSTSGGKAQRWTVPVGPLYSVLQPLAEQDGLGITLYLESADADVGYVLKFATYRGVDRTSTQTVLPLVRLTPNMESLSGLKEIRSIDGYKNVVYLVYGNQVTMHYEDPANIPEGLNRRVMVRDAEGEPIGTTMLYSQGYYGGGYARPYVGSEDLARFRDRNAKDAFANNNYIRAVDGQVSQTNEYKFGTDYGLGDIIELEGMTGILQKARITEYIRTQDSTGVREYPTLSVIG